MTTIPQCPICRTADATRTRHATKPWHCIKCNTVYSGSQGELTASREDRERYLAHQVSVQRMKDGYEPPEPTRRLRSVK